MITATKSLIGHALGAAGGIESVASILMLKGGFLQPAINCEDVHPEIQPFANSIPHQGGEISGLDILVKAGFGFGDVNACLILKRWGD
jgi:3-oxoacyl-(acyl-carrier-protein) synthase